MINLDEIKAVVFGHAIGDALGFPVEFFTRQELEENPVVDMLKNEMYNTPAGAWSDDTSMALCALDSLSTGKLDFDDVMQKFGKWYYQNEYTVAGEVIGEGNTCSLAIENYFKHNKTIYDCGLDREDTNGNGSLMRIYPFVLYLATKNMPIGKKLENIHMASALTHAHQCSKVACGIYAFVLWELLNTKTRNKLVIRNALTKAKNYYSQYTELDLSYFNGLFDEISLVCAKCDNIALENKINTSGYVVDTLVASIYCLFATNSYSECVLKAVNLGDDTDTTAAVAGSIAGLLYGYDSIPKTWIKALVKQEYIESICNKANYIWSNNITIQRKFKPITTENVSLFWSYLYKQVKNSKTTFRSHKAIEIKEFYIYFKPVNDIKYCLCAYKDDLLMRQKASGIAGLNIFIMENELQDYFINGFNKSEELILLKNNYKEANRTINHILAVQDHSLKEDFYKALNRRRFAIREKNRIENTRELFLELKKYWKNNFFDD